MSNFAFLPPEFSDIQDAATRAEGHIRGDPRAACFHARFTLEAIVHWLYRHDRDLHHPYDNSLGALLHATSFQNLVPQAVYLKARLIQRQGNEAVHHPRPVREQDALQVVRELHHVCYWLVRTYAPVASRAGASWRDDRVPLAPDSIDLVPRKELEALEQRLAEQNAEALKRQQERDALDTQLQEVRAQLADIRAAAEQVPDDHDYSEAETRRYLIDLELERAGWSLTHTNNREYEVTGMPTANGLGYADYVLWGDDGKPLAVIEAKKTTLDSHVGQQQAKLYADCLERMHGQRPLIFTTNGYATWLWDDTQYPPRQVAGFYSLHAEVAAMNRDNFIVRMQLEQVERFQDRAVWDDLTEQDRETLRQELAGLPTEIETDDIQSRLFDLTALRMQLALAESDPSAFERHRQRVVELAMLLEEKRAIPAVQTQLGYLADLQENAFWEGIGLVQLEDMRLRLRTLVPLLDKKERKVVYTDFKDEVLGVREEPAIAIPKMTGVQYEKKVKAYLKSHLNNIVIHRLRTNQPLTPTDLLNLETTLVKIGEEDGETLLFGLLERNSAPSMVHFVRNLVGMDRQSAQAAFAQFLNDRSLDATQIRFIELIIDQLTARGIMDAAALYEPPFSHLHAGGPDALFAGHENVIDGVFETLKGLNPERLATAAA